MSGVSMLVAAKEMKKIARDIRKIERAGLNMKMVWRRAGSWIARDNRRQFATKGSFQGTPWKPLAASTLRQKLRSGGRRQMLRRSDELFRSFTGRPMGIEDIQQHEAHFGSPLMKAIWHQNGTHRNGKQHIPARPIQKLNNGTRQDIIEAVVKHVMKGIR